MRSIHLSLLALMALTASAAPAAQVASVFGGRVSCTERDGIQFCQGGLDARVPSWDGVPLDVAVTLPPADRTGPFPLIVDLHGWGLSKSTGPNTARAQAGYVVLSYTARGFGDSCGSARSRMPDPTLPDADACGKRGWIRLGDARYEARDTQYLAGLLADEGLVIPDRVGVTGISYGGGQSMILAALHNRTMLPDGTLVPWTSAGGLTMGLAAAAPLIPWSDLAQALTPNGRTLDYRVDNSYGARAGVQKKSWEDVLYATGLGNFYAPAGADPDADLSAWHARMAQGEPYDGDPLLQHALEQLTRYHSAYYIDDSVPPAPVFIYNSWVDDLFPGDEALRYWRKTRAKHGDAEIFLQLAAGFGHPRADLAAAASLVRVFGRVDDFFARYLQAAAVPPPPNFETYSQSCGGAPELGPFIDTDWDVLRHGEVRFSDGTSRSFTATSASAAVAAKLDPLGGGPCRTLPADDDPGAATWRLPAVTGAGDTLMGAPTVIADITVSGSFAQVVARLWDVAPDGTQTLVTHLLHRPRSDNLGPQVFQLHPNGWHFAAGHVPKLELAGQSPPYGHTATGDFHVAVSNLELRLPVVEAPDGGAVGSRAADVLPPDAVEPPDAGMPACGDAPATDCKVTRHGKLKWKRDRLAWSWGGAAGDTSSKLGVPPATTAYRLCIWDKSRKLAASVAVPAGGECAGKKGPAACWTTEPRGFRYADRAAASDGVQLVQLAVAKHRVSLALRARVDRSASGRVRAQLQNAIGGCWETRGGK